MRFSNNDASKRQHAEKLKTYIVMEQMQRHVSEEARKNFNRKPYQIGVNKNDEGNK